MIHQYKVELLERIKKNQERENNYIFKKRIIRNL